METESINQKNDFDFPVNPSHTKNYYIIATAAAKCIHHNHYISNEANRYQVSDIEMITIQAAYTSLKDLLPTSPASSSLSPKDSWREIPIKDPLVQHAAWAYLQPMQAAAPSDDRNLLEKLTEKCCGLFGCIGDVLLIMTRNWFRRKQNKKIQLTDEIHDPSQTLTQFTELLFEKLCSDRQLPFCNCTIFLFVHMIVFFFFSSFCPLQFD